MPKLNIAVIEDEGIVALDIKKSLESLGYGVAFVSDTGEDAIAKLEQFKVDLVLMDIVLKGNMDGIDTARIIMEQMKIPVVFLTAFDDEATEGRAGSLKTAGFLVKPFENAKLKKVIENSFRHLETPVEAGNLPSG